MLMFISFSYNSPRSVGKLCFRQSVTQGPRILLSVAPQVPTAGIGNHFFVKSQIVSILGYARHMVSVLTKQLCCIMK